MAAKAFFVFCASALLVQTISAQCIGAAPGLINYGNGLGLANNLAASGIAGCGYGVPAAIGSGGGLTVSTSSLYAPTGITVVSENAIEGIVDIAGQLPVLAAVGLEGQLPTAGAAGLAYSCGNGNVGIASELAGPAGPNAGLAYGGLGLANAGLANAGLVNAGLANAGLANAGLIGAGLAPGLVGYNGVAGCGVY